MTYHEAEQIPDDQIDDLIATLDAIVLDAIDPTERTTGLMLDNDAVQEQMRGAIRAALVSWTNG